MMANRDPKTAPTTANSGRGELGFSGKVGGSRICTRGYEA